MLVVEWGQFQYLDLNHKPLKNKFLFFNKKDLTLNLINKITQQNASIAKKSNLFFGIRMKNIQKQIPQLPSFDEWGGYNET